MEYEYKAVSNTDWGNLEWSERSLSQCHFIYHKSHVGWDWIERMGLQRPRRLAPCAMDLPRAKC